jgi:hypothetical protein
VGFAFSLSGIAPYPEVAIRPQPYVATLFNAEDIYIVASEELEKSLRAEVERHVSSRLGELQQELSQLQTKIGEEVARLQSAVSGDLAEMNERVAGGAGTSDEISLAITDHIRAAHKQGIEEAAAESAATQTGSDLAILKAAIVEIGQQSGQAAVLKSLVNHAAAFAPRVAFFIVKNDYLVGWRARGLEGTVGDDAIKEINFPILSENILSEAANSEASWTGQPGSLPGDNRFLDPMGGNPPQHAAAIPLVARGRSVAVLYADSGDLDADSINLEALESLMRVTGMAVELLANAPAGGGRPKTPAIQQDINETYRELTAASSAVEDHAPEPAEMAYEAPPAMDAYDASMAPEPTPGYAIPDTSYAAFDSDTHQDDVYETPVTEPAPAYAQEAWVADPEPVHYEPIDAEEVETEPIETASTFEFNQSVYDAAPVEAPPVVPAFTPEPEPEPTPEPIPEPVAAPAAAAPAAEAATRTRSWSRDTELPIEVPEEDRKVHNDARRFARLLVSEIKLYNEQKVREGREAGDIYQRLQEAIDRSREMYDKRAAPAVAARYDYFYNEVINTLAEGDTAKMGADFPGATV